MEKQITKEDEAKKADVKMSMPITNEDFEEFHLKIGAADLDGVRNMLEIYGEALFSNDSSSTALHLAAACNNSAILQAIIDKLPKWKKKITLNSRRGCHTPLFIAVEKGLVCNIEILLANDVTVDKIGLNEETALFYAIIRRDYNIAKLLLAKGASIDKTNLDGQTVLHLAVVDGDVAAVGEILKNGADVDKKDATGQTALMLAIESNHENLITLLIDHGVSADCSSLRVAMKSDRAGLLLTLLQHGAVVNAIDEHGWTALHYATKIGKIDTVQMLLTNGAKVDHLTSDSKSALQLAIEENHEDIVELLLDQGNHGRSNVTTALLTAAKFGRTNIVDEAMQRGANVNAVDVEGWTALHFAVNLQDLKTTKMLLKHGASINKKTVANITLLHMVNNKSQKGKELYQFLRSRGAKYT